MKKFNRSILVTLIASSLLFSATAFAAPKTLAQNCELGNTCPVPGNDGGQTLYTVTPKSGTEYACEFNSSGDSMRFSIFGGKDFHLTHGYGIYTASPEAKVIVKGRFENPNDQNDIGVIKITRLPLSADGTVKCYATNQ